MEHTEEKSGLLNVKSLKELVYDYLREEFHSGNLRAGAVINMDATSRKLGISKTPLRDALIQLEMEGFVTIAPRRGIYVNPLTGADIREYYEVIGALESMALQSAFPHMQSEHVERMARLNRKMADALKHDNFEDFYQNNLQFHDTFVQLNQNRTLIHIVSNLKKRLYDFPRQPQWIKEWEENSVLEHQTLVELIRTGKAADAAAFIRDVHWSYAVQEKFIQRYYLLEDEAGIL